MYNPNFLCVFSICTLDAPKPFPLTGIEYAKALEVWDSNCSFLRMHREPGEGKWRWPMNNWGTVSLFGAVFLPFPPLFSHSLWGLQSTTLTAIPELLVTYLFSWVFFSCWWTVPSFFVLEQMSWATWSLLMKPPGSGVSSPSLKHS